MKTLRFIILASVLALFSGLALAQLKRLATRLGTTVYQLKSGLLDDYMSQQLKYPSIPMVLCA